MSVEYPKDSITFIAQCRKNDRQPIGRLQKHNSKNGQQSATTDRFQRSTNSSNLYAEQQNKNIRPPKSRGVQAVTLDEVPNRFPKAAGKYTREDQSWPSFGPNTPVTDTDKSIRLSEKAFDIDMIYHHKHHALDTLIRSVSRVTAALSNVS